MALPYVTQGSKLALHVQENTPLLFEHVDRAVAQGTPFPFVKTTQEHTRLRAVKGRSPLTITAARAVARHDGMQGVANITTDAEIEWWADEVLRPLYEYARHNPDFLEYVDVWELINEADPAGVYGHLMLGQVMRRCAERVAVDFPGLLVGVGSFNMGCPEYDEMVAFVESGVFKMENVVLCLHEGIPKPDDPIDKWHSTGPRPQPDKHPELPSGLIPGAPSVPEHGGALYGRVAYWHQILGEKMPPTLITEAYLHAYGSNAEIRRRVEWVDALYSKLWYVIGWAPFTYAPTPDWKHQDYTPAYGATLLDYMASVTDRQNEQPPTKEKDMPGLNYKSIVILLPQNATLDHILQVRRDEYANRRTITQSLDEALRLRQLGEEGSYIIAYDLEEWSEAEQALILAGPHKLRRLTPEKLFAVPLASDNWTILPGGKFDTPRDYRSINPHVKQRHEGLDFSATAGGLIAIAPRDGVVEARGYKADGYGYWVRLRHDLPGVTYKTWVAHMAGPAEVAPGQTVKRAQRLGLVGSTGNSTGVHVHFTVQKIPGGLSGYIVDSVVDPEPLTDLTPIAAPYNPVPAPPAPPPTQPSVDMAQFFLPAAGNYGDIVILKNNWGQGDERQQLQRDGNISFVTKNQQYERRIIGGDRITLDLDTSPGDGEFYRVESSTGWMPRYWQPGETFSRTETARFYRKDNCEAVNKVLSGTSILRFVALHGSYTTRAGVTFNTVAEMVWERNGAVEERYWYAKGCGLIAWKNRHGRESWAVEQIPLGQQKSNNREIIPCA